MGLAGWSIGLFLPGVWIMPAISRIDVEQVPGVGQVVRFRDSRLFDDTTVREVADQISASLPAEGPPRLILDFGGVETISSSMLGKLILLHRRITDGRKGRLRLCNLNSVARSVFRSTNLDRLFLIDHDLAEAREAIVGT
jgi:anti-anti-sigma factor